MHMCLYTSTGAHLSSSNLVTENNNEGTNTTVVPTPATSIQSFSSVSVSSSAQSQQNNQYDHYPPSEFYFLDSTPSPKKLSETRQSQFDVGSASKYLPSGTAMTTSTATTTTNDNVSVSLGFGINSDGISDNNGPPPCTDDISTCTPETQFEPIGPFDFMPSSFFKKTTSIRKSSKDKSKKSLKTTTTTTTTTTKSNKRPRTKRTNQQEEQVLNDFLTPLERRRKRNRESMQRARQRQREEIEEMRETLRLLERQYHQLSVQQKKTHDDKPNKSKSTDDGVYCNFSTTTPPTNRMMVLKRKYNEISSVSMGLRKENMRLRKELEEQTKWKQTLSRILQDIQTETISSSTASSCFYPSPSSSFHSMANTTFFTEANAKEFIQQTMKEFKKTTTATTLLYPKEPPPTLGTPPQMTSSIKFSSSSSSSSEVNNEDKTMSKSFGWKEKRLVQDSKVSFSFEKKFPHLSCEELVEKTWENFDLCTQPKGQEIKKSEILQIVNENIHLCARERKIPQHFHHHHPQREQMNHSDILNEEEKEEMDIIVQSAFLKFKVKTEKGFVIGRKTIQSNLIGENPYFQDDVSFLAEFSTCSPSCFASSSNTTTTSSTTANEQKQIERSTSSSYDDDDDDDAAEIVKLVQPLLQRRIIQEKNQGETETSTICSSSTIGSSHDILHDDMEEKFKIKEEEEETKEEEEDIAVIPVSVGAQEEEEEEEVAEVASNSKEKEEDGGCQVKFGGYSDYNTLLDIPKRLMDSLLGILTWENIVVGHLISLPST